MPIRSRLVALVVLGGLAACGATAPEALDARAAAAPSAAPASAPLDPVAAHRAEVDAWHAQREERLASPTGYLALVGLTWIGQGAHTVGSGVDCDVLLPAGLAPELLGTLHVQGDALRFVAAEGQQVIVDDEPFTELELRSDAHADGRTTLHTGDVAFWVIRRGAKLGVRVRDPESPTRRAYTGTERFPVDPAWRVQARFVPFVAPRSVAIPNVSGETSNELLAGELQFEIDGETHSLIPLPEDDGSYWLIFADATTGEQTYRGGRFLVTEIAADDGTVWIDFNRAYNPPCAYSSFTTCPLPPEGNRLAVPVTAGERKPAPGSAH